MPDLVVSLWDNRSSGGEDTEGEGSETGGSWSECEVVEEEEDTKGSNWGYVQS